MKLWWIRKMTEEEKKINEFITEVSIKAKELCKEYVKLAENNKQKSLNYIEYKVRTSRTQNFME